MNIIHYITNCEKTIAQFKGCNLVVHVAIELVIYLGWYIMPLSIVIKYYDDEMKTVSLRFTYLAIFWQLKGRNSGVLWSIKRVIVNV